MKTVIYLYLFFKITCNSNGIKVDTKLETVYYEGSDKRYNGIVLYTRTGNEEKTQKFNLELNLGLKKVIVANYNILKWGIICDINYDNSCIVDSEEILEDFYYFKHYNYQKAITYIKFFPGDFINNENLPKLKLDFMMKSQFWQMDKMGVVGLSPQGDFASYLRKIYKDDIFVLIEFNSVIKMQEKKFFELNFILNPAYSRNIIKLQFVLKNKDYYDTPGDLVFGRNSHKRIIFKQQKMCFTTIQDSLIFLPNRYIYCNQLLSEICEDPLNCNKKNADFNKALEIVIKIENKEFIFDYKDYFYFDQKDKIGCRFGSLDPKAFNVCDEDTIFGIGKVFIEKYPIIVGFQKNGDTTFILLNKNILNDYSALFLFILCMIPTIFSCLIVIYICFIKEWENDSYELYIPIGIN